MDKRIMRAAWVFSFALVAACSDDDVSLQNSENNATAAGEDAGGGSREEDGGTCGPHEVLSCLAVAQHTRPVRLCACVPKR